MRSSFGHPGARAMGRQPFHLLVPPLPALTAAPRTAARRVGHKGAHHIAPGNTHASFDAAIAHGVDMIEFDVLATDWRQADTCDIVLAHDYSEDLPRALSLRDGLAYLASP